MLAIFEKKKRRHQLVVGEKSPHIVIVFLGWGHDCISPLYFILFLLAFLGSWGNIACLLFLPLSVCFPCLTDFVLIYCAYALLKVHILVSFGIPFCLLLWV